LFTLRDSSLKTGWLYVLVAFGIGAAYLIIRRVTRGPLPELSTKSVTGYHKSDEIESH